MPQSAAARGGKAGVHDDDYALMDRLQARDPAAMSTLYDRYSPIVMALCRRGLRDQQEAEDLLLEIFSEIWERADRFDPARGSPMGHVLGIARSRLIDRIRSRRSARRRSTATSLELHPERFESVDGNPREAAIFAERQRQTRQAVDRLPPEQREALELAFFDAMTHAEVAEHLGQPLGTVKSRIRQALITLREVLKQLNPQ